MGHAPKTLKNEFFEWGVAWRRLDADKTHKHCTVTLVDHENTDKLMMLTHSNKLLNFEINFFICLLDTYICIHVDGYFCYFDQRFCLKTKPLVITKLLLPSYYVLAADGTRL